MTVHVLLRHQRGRDMWDGGRVTSTTDGKRKENQEKKEEKANKANRKHTLRLAGYSVITTVI